MFYESRESKIHIFTNIRLKDSDSVHSVKYLGAYLSDDLRWNENVKNVSNKANKTIGFLKRNLRHCPPRTKETAYCSCVWDPYRAKNTNKLEMVERKAA